MSWRREWRTLVVLVVNGSVAGFTTRANELSWVVNEQLKRKVKHTIVKPRAQLKSLSFRASYRSPLERHFPSVHAGSARRASGAIELWWPEFRKWVSATRFPFMLELSLLFAITSAKSSSFSPNERSPGTPQSRTSACIQSPPVRGLSLP